MKKIPLFLFFLFITTLSRGQQLQYKEADNIYYYDATTVENDSTAYQKQMSLLDIYYPETEKKVPVIIWFHGGGLTGGQKEIPDALKNHGYCIVGVGYRLSPKVKAETSVADAARAVAWVFNNINKYNGDPAEIFVSGHSAGGYLALMTVIDKDWLAKYDIDANSVAKSRHIVRICLPVNFKSCRRSL